jgi:hypothetical protein
MFVNKCVSFICGEGSCEFSELSFFFPPCSDGFELGIEPNTVLAVEVEVSSEGSLATSEGEHGEGNGDRDVHTNLSNFHLILELSSSGSRSGEDSSTITPSIAVNEVDTFLEGVDFHTHKHGAEDFFLVAGHVRGDIVNDRGGNKVSLGILRVDVITTIKNHSSTLLLSTLHDADNSLLQLGIGNWADVDSFLITSTDLEALSLGH